MDNDWYAAETEQLRIRVAERRGRIRCHAWDGTGVLIGRENNVVLAQVGP